MDSKEEDIGSQLMEEINDSMITDNKPDKFIYRTKLLEILRTHFSSVLGEMSVKEEGKSEIVPPLDKSAGGDQSGI